MSHTKKRHLILEKLEERIFLDANPVAVAADGVDPTDVDMLETADVQTAQQAAEEQTPVESTDGSQETESQGDVVSDEPVLEADGEEASQTDPTEQEESDDTVGNVETTATEETADDTEGLPQDQERTLALTETAAEPETIEQIVFVDSTVTDHETLVDGVVSDLEQRDAEDSSTGQTTSGTTVVILDGATDQVQQITDTLSSYSQLSGVHIISHGSENSLQLGDTLLDSSNIEEYESQLSLWGDALSEEGDILLYGCNIAEDVSEENFIEALAEITGADVAASDDPTGNAASGGDWDLEVATGDIETEVLKDASGEWDGLLDPTPLSSGSASNDNPMINSDFTFTVSFDNASTTDGDVGYGPYVDVVVPNAIQVSDVEIFELGVAPEIYTWDGTQWVSDLGDDGVLGTADDTIITEHPGQSDGPDPWPELAMPTATNAGDKWYYIVKPFGSFTPDQPVADVVFTATANTANGAVVGTDYDITHRAGFLYGDTADNQNGPIQEASEGTITITPQVIDIEKTTTIGEDQTVTGPNYPVEYTLTVNVAAGETVSGVVIEDYLPKNAVYRGDVSISKVNSNADDIDMSVDVVPTAWTVLGSASDASDRLLQITLDDPSTDTVDDDITGAASSDSGYTEWEITYSVYFSDVAADGSPLLDATGDDSSALNEASISGTYTYPDNTAVEVTNGSDSTLGALNDAADDSATPSDVELEITSITAKKSVSTIDPDTGAEGVDPVPGTILQYSVQVSVSDYYEAGNILVEDEFGDGQTLLTSSDGYNLTVTVHEENADGNPATQTYDLDGYYTVNAVDTDDGSTPLTFNISALLGDETGNGTLTGAAFDGDIEGAQSASDTLNEDRRSGDATYVTITFFTQIDDSYDYLQNSGTSDASIDLGDSISNDVTVTADITDAGGATAPQEDSSATSLTIEGGEVNKEIYAINGFLLDENNQWSEDGGTTYYDLDTNGVLPGDLVTYHITLDLDLADFENLFITDFLPFPVYDVTEINTNTADDFDGVIEMTAGEVEFGPDHNLNGSYISGLQHNGSDAGLLNTDNAPIVDATNNSANNAVTFDFGSYDAPATTSDAVTIDLLLTVTISDEPMVDGLPLTNQVVTSINDTTNEIFQDDDIVQVQLNQPELSIVKGVVETDNDEDDAGIFADNDAVDGYFTDPGDSGFRFEANSSLLTSEWLDSESGSGPDLDTDLSNVDAGDTVTYAVIIENTGGGPAYDLVLSDALPTGYTASDVSNFYISYQWRLIKT